MNCEPIQVFAPTPPSISQKNPNDGVTAEFKNSSTNELSKTPESQLKLTIEECICLASSNSAKANLIDKEREAISRQNSKVCPHSLDIALAAQAIEQRNKSAGQAGALFLRLVEFELQQELLDDSQVKLLKFKETIRAAAEQGFATADGIKEIDKRQIDLDSRQAKIKSSFHRVSYQLTSLIGRDPSQLMVYPVHHVFPNQPQRFLKDEVNTGFQNRELLKSFEQLVNSQSDDDQIQTLLAQFDSRLGLSLPAKVLRKRLLRIRNSESARDPSGPTRREQLNDAYRTAKTVVQSEIADAVFAIEAAQLDLDAASKNITRLEKLDVQIAEKKKLDSKKTYLEAQQNWIELQAAKSTRISAAVAMQNAELKLLEAQGLLTAGCGYEHGSDCACDGQ